MGDFEIDIAGFQVRVLDRSRTVPVLVDFWAGWCSPCRALGPVLEKLVSEADGAWELAKVDTERHPQLAARFGVRSIPNVKLFVDGQVADEFVGALPEEAVRRWLRAALPGPRHAEIEQARGLIAEQRLAEARRILQDVLTDEPDDEATVLLAEATVFANPQEALELAQRIGAGAKQADRAAAIATFARLFSQLDSADDLPDSRARAPFVTAIEALRNRDFGSALAGFVEVIRKDRGYADDAPRQACLAVFQYLGADHSLTRKHRKDFANAVLA